MENCKMGVGKIGRSSTTITFAIVLLLLCYLNVTNGQQSVYSIVQRESFEGVREEHGSQINDMLRGPNDVLGSPVSEIGQGEIRGNVGPSGPIYPIGPVGLNPYPGPNPRSEIGQGEIRGNVGPSGPIYPIGPVGLNPRSEIGQGEIRGNVDPSTSINHNATNHVVIPLPPQSDDNNMVIGNRVIKSEPTIYENVRQPYVTTSQPAEQEAVIVPPTAIYESPPPSTTGEVPGETNITLSSPPPPSSSVIQVDPEANNSSSTGMNSTTVPNTQAQYSIPIADAGPNLIVHPSQQVILDGSKSYDPSGDPLYFLWLQLAGGPTLPLLNSTAPNPSFVAPVVTNATTVTFELLVGDGQRASMPSYTYVTIEP
jgi:hypothetical protein